MKTNVQSLKFTTLCSNVNHTHVPKTSSNAVKANNAFPIKYYPQMELMLFPTKGIVRLQKVIIDKIDEK